MALDPHLACYATPYIYIYIYTGLRMAGGVQAPRALVALDLRVACYATPYIGHRRVVQLRDPTHIHKAP